MIVLFMHLLFPEESRSIQDLGVQVDIVSNHEDLADHDAQLPLREMHLAVSGQSLRDIFILLNLMLNAGLKYGEYGGLRDSKANR